ncbi:uncharacterized protein BXZ73DRAFT_108505 [Epithele typhae]|uniref:uncharacterized protein n=1 Tax=Epithele typhae TaxID=378194 RepID=UPI002007C9BF|nr:uncharacterized protein BXZ73DRAFT_109474 [Epithele typhae]XP_047871106.1 uncharacterized protein BXZ73DRAFT_108505 [Epithele typhae]KAH9910157.1 hypothetical protein BXZ73DRAFT_109474 [Epithele typhae]KAH9910804.1 hypothetical protein BXZ73DRAFT_108505 [Epithele typhae]
MMVATTTTTAPLSERVALTLITVLTQDCFLSLVECFLCFGAVRLDHSVRQDSVDGLIDAVSSKDNKGHNMDYAHSHSASPTD